MGAKHPLGQGDELHTQPVALWQLALRFVCVPGRCTLETDCALLVRSAAYRSGMSQLTSEQHAAVQRWAGEGATLNDLQQRLKAEFGVSLTYLEARLLMLDLNVKIQDKPREQPKAEEPAPEPAEETPPDAEEPGAEPAAPGGLRLEVDQLAIPGAIISGKVTFSDGQAAGWYLDQMGRLGLRGTEPGYKPPQQDVPLFQQELDRVLAQAGF